MGYRNLQQALDGLAAAGQLRVIDHPLDPRLEIGMVQRRVYASGGPALLFTNPVGSAFPLLGNLYGTLERTRFLFRDTLRGIERLVAAKVEPKQLLKEPLALASLLPAAWHLLPKRVASGPVLAQTTTVGQLPCQVSWPLDGGPFVTLPQVYTESPERPGLRHGNLGMYRVQLAGNSYRADKEVGLHYQIHRGIGVHHAEAVAKGEKLRVNVFVGGPPALAVAAVMPLPEGMPELAFAGLLAGERLSLVTGPGGLPIPAEADFCICGSIDPARTLPEGPFGDHLGYYSLAHDFPVLEVEQVYHRPDAIWPFTTVGRPPQEDTSFGTFIHELTGALIPTVLPGVAAVHAVDAAGVHPLLLAVGSERYTPYAGRREPMELLTQANAILGQGQLSLAKFLCIVAREDAPGLDPHDVAAFFRHLLERVDWRRDLHFQTRTTIDTLDYSGHGLNAGSKVVIAVAGEPLRQLPTELPAELRLPAGCSAPKVCLPGVLAIQGPAATAGRGLEDVGLAAALAELAPTDAINRFPLVLLVDDSDFVARSLANFLWVTFIRANPATDLYGIGVEQQAKHWGCRGSLVIDARCKPFHAPPLEEEPALVQKIEGLAASGGPLAGLF